MPPHPLSGGQWGPVDDSGGGEDHFKVKLQQTNLNSLSLSSTLALIRAYSDQLAEDKMVSR